MLPGLGTSFGASYLLSFVTKNLVIVVFHEIVPKDAIKLWEDDFIENTMGPGYIIRNPNAGVRPLGTLFWSPQGLSYVPSLGARRASKYYGFTYDKQFLPAEKGNISIINLQQQDKRNARNWPAARLRLLVVSSPFVNTMLPVLPTVYK